MKAIAAGLAIAITQALILVGLLNVQTTPYLTSATSSLAIVFGGSVFGLGMALICGWYAMRACIRARLWRTSQQH